MVYWIPGGVVAKARKVKNLPRRGRPIKRGSPQAPARQSSQPSLPPAAPEPVTAPPSTAIALPSGVALHPDSSIRTTALKIVAMRQAGLGEDEIALALGLKRSTLAGYVYKAGRNGWLDSDDPHDRLEYQVLHKVVQRLDEALDSNGVLMNGMPVKTQVALKTAEGTLFKKFGQEQATTMPTTVVAIKVEMPAGVQVTEIREGTTGGAPAFIEAELNHGDPVE